MSDTNYVAELVATARAISAPGKGILAADESTGTIGKRFAGINVEVSPNKFVLLTKFDFLQNMPNTNQSQLTLYIFCLFFFS